MSRLDQLLNERISTAKESTKVKELAKKSAEGNMTSVFSLFLHHEITPTEREALAKLLLQFSQDGELKTKDLDALAAITSEVRSINHQAILLHGERIKKAQSVLKSYKEGAFTAWLMAAYGNRQTPYNFLLYYDLHTTLSPELQDKFQLLPKKLAYALASRKGALEDKQEMITSFSDQPKEAFLQKLRTRFPLPVADSRKTPPLRAVSRQISSLSHTLKQCRSELSEKDLSSIKTQLKVLLAELST